jgi:hypothetical protein
LSVPTGLTEQRGNGPHRQKQPVLVLGESQEIEVQVKTPSLSIDRIHHHGCGGNVTRLLVSALQGIQKQECAQLLTMKATVNSETVKECGRNDRIARKLFGNIRG